MAENPYAKYLPQAAAPQPGPVYGAPPKPDKPDQPKTSYRPLTPEEVAQRGLPADQRWQISSEGKVDPVTTKQSSATEFQSKAAQFYGRMLQAERQFNAVPADSRDARTVPGQWFKENLPGVENTWNSADRQMSDAAARNWIASSLRQESGAAIGAQEYDNQYRIFFPMPGDGPEVLAQKAEARKQAMEGFRIAAGPLAQEIDAINAKRDDEQSVPPPVGLLDPNAGTTGPGNAFDQPEPPPGMKAVTGDKKTVTDSSLSDAMFAMLQAGAPYESIYAFARQHGEVPWSKESFDKAVNYWYKQRGQNPFTPQEKQVDTTWRERAAAGDAAAFASSVGDAFTGGRMDEIAGGLAALGGGDYTTARDAFDAKKRAVADLNPVVNAVGSITGGVLAGATGGGIASRVAPGATGYVTNALARIPGASPAAGGAAYGAYYGSGDDNQNRLAGGAIGATIGGLTGGAVGRTQSAIANRGAANAVRGAEANALAQAGNAEGITINRALVEPKYQNRVSGVDASTLGGPKFQAGMQQIEGQFADAVGRIGGGRALDKAQLGDVVSGAGERAIENTGKIAKAKYDRAVNMAGDTKIKPAQAMQKVDEAIAKLSETPETFKAEIAYLQTLKKDLSNDLSVEGLRRLRTTQRNKISKGDLVFGEDEARVLGIMDAAANDIRNGLTAAGKGNAAKAFDTADKAYRARMDYVKGTVQKVLGKRNANKSAEGMAGTFAGMSKTDVAGLKRFQASLTPEERADVASTFAQNLGLTGKKDFSVNAFMTNTSPKNVSDDALRAMLGNDGFQSVQNLRLIGKELERVTGAMNSRTSKTAVANNWQNWLWQTAIGGGLGYGAGGGDSKTALMGAAAIAGGKGAREYLTAKMLLNPNITKWLKSAPATTNPRAIDAHFARLKAIAKTSPALADDIERFSQSIFAAANDNAGIPAAAGNSEKDK